jgi:sec-independent protein translocase protein TatA
MIDGLFQPTHLVFILVVVLIVFGAGRLPEVFGQLGKGVRTFRDESSATPTAPSISAGSAVSAVAAGFCSKCGARAADGKFCSSCGAPLPT